MTQSAGHIEAGPNACPFVALENDRDARAPAPDERHRCYAENVPAPRTLAHQERFCLSPHFAGCPIFAEWAVRAAARPVPGADTDTSTGSAPVATAGMAAAAAAGTAEAAPELWFERIDKTVEPARDERWPDSMDAAPPAAAALAAQAASERDAQQLAAFAAPPPPAARDEPPHATSAMRAAPHEDDRGFDPAPLPTFLTERSPRARTSVHQPVTDESLAPVAEPDVRRSSGRGDDGDGPFTRLLTMAAVLIILALGVATVLIVPGLLAGNPGQAAPSRVASASQRPTALSSLEAGVPTTSPVDATVAPQPEPSTPVPAATPTPTPRSYKIQPGDRLRQIARDHGVTVEQILAANPEIADPNDIQVGQRIVIPAP